MSISPRGATVMFAILAGLAVARAAAPSDRTFLGGPAMGIAPAQAQETAATGIFHGVGVVKAIDGATGALTLDHEEIKGFMAAMEMMYRVKPPALSADLRVGDKIAFDIDAGHYTIVGVTVVEHAK
ncbi:MAG TPA: copper-binding protein [Roseiarcus sp.]|nr:copper-binding protein [Roseiarcus sp.]